MQQEYEFGGGSRATKDIIDKTIQANYANQFKEIEKKNKACDAKTIALRSIQTSLLDLKEKTVPFTLFNNFKEKAAVVTSDPSLPKLAEIKAELNANLNSHSLKVIQLAAKCVLQTTKFPNAEGIQGTGVLSIQLGNSITSVYNTKSIRALSMPLLPSVSSNGESLAMNLSQIVDLINLNAAGYGIVAELIDVDDNLVTAQCLQIYAQDTGTQNAITGLNVTNTDGSLSLLNFSNLIVKNEAKDAIFELDSNLYTRPSNTINNINGIDLELIELAPSNNLMTFKVTLKPNNLLKYTEDWIKSFNSVLEQLHVFATTKNLSTETFSLSEKEIQKNFKEEYLQDAQEDAEIAQLWLEPYLKRSVLANEMFIKSLSEDLRQLPSNKIAGLSGYQRLCEIGLVTKRDTNHLFINKELFNRSQSKFPENMIKLMVGSIVGNNIKGGVLYNFHQQLANRLQLNSGFAQAIALEKSKQDKLLLEKENLVDKANSEERYLKKSFSRNDTVIARNQQISSALQRMS